jgi:hypothetical protein
MSIRHRPDLEERGSVLWRSVVVLLLVGAGLGLVSNAVLQAAGNKRGLAWVRTEKVLPSLEDLGTSPVAESIATAPSTTPEQVATDVAPVNPTASTPAATAKKPPASSSAPKPATPPAASGDAKPSGGPPAAGTTAAPNGEKSVPTGTKVDVPTVPDSRDPIQAKMPMVKNFYDADAVRRRARGGRIRRRSHRGCDEPAVRRSLQGSEEARDHRSGHQADHRLLRRRRL